VSHAQSCGLILTSQLKAKLVYTKTNTFCMDQTCNYIIVATELKRMVFVLKTNAF